MKIGIITIIDNINIGSILQAYALCKKLQDLGHKVILIDYWRDSQTLKGTIKTEFQNKDRNLLLKCSFILGKTVLNSYIKHKLRRPLVSNINVSKRYKSLDEIKSNLPDADIYITGSDQVWNTQYNNGVDRAFFLDFTDKPKLSYACSIGENEFPKQYVPDIYRLLSEYRNISLRERLSTEYLKSLGFEEAYTDVDPTLLITKTEWLEYLPLNGQLPEMPYLFVYSVEGKNNDFIFKQAEILASEMNLKIVALTTSPSIMLKKYKIDRIYSFAEASQFIHLIANASFVVASSFHGTAFSINFNRQFITIAPDKFNIRILSLLTDLNINDRIVHKQLIHKNDISDIDYVFVNDKLTRLRNQSLENLRKSINSIKL